MNPVVKIVIEVVLVALIGGAIGWGINGWRLQSQVEKAKAEYSEAKAAAYQEALTKMQDDMKRVADAAEGARVVTADLEKSLDKLTKEFKNAKPLPVDCRPDDFRMQSLSKAVAELQRTLSGSKPSSSVQDAGSPGSR